MYSFDFWDLPFWEWFLFIYEMVMLGFFLRFFLGHVVMLGFVDLHTWMLGVSYLHFPCLDMLGHDVVYRLAFSCWEFHAGIYRLAFSCWEFFTLGHAWTCWDAGIYMLGFTCWDLHTWIYMLGFTCWEGILGFTCWDLHAWICMLGFTYLDLHAGIHMLGGHTWIYILGFAYLDLHAGICWDMMWFIDLCSHAGIYILACWDAGICIGKSNMVRKK